MRKRKLAAVAAEQLDLGFVPERFGVEQQAVHVEHHGAEAPRKRHATQPRSGRPASAASRSSGVTWYRPSGLPA